MTYIVPFTCSVKETRNQNNFTYIHVCDKKRKNNNNNNNNKTKQRKKKTKHYHEHVTSCRDIFHIGHRSLDRVLHNCIFLVSWNRMLVSTSLESVWIIFTKLSILKITNFCWFIFSMFVQSMTTFSEGPEDVCVIDSCLQNIIFKTRVLVNKSVIFSVRIKSQINLLKQNWNLAPVLCITSCWKGSIRSPTWSYTCSPKRYLKLDQKIDILNLYSWLKQGKDFWRCLKQVPALRDVLVWRHSQAYVSWRPRSWCNVV